jgi:hypothetical protein
MNAKTLISSLLLACAAGIAVQASAAEDHASALSPDACISVRHELDAIEAHLFELRSPPEGRSSASNGHGTLVLALSPHLDALQTQLPVQGTPRAQASMLLSDMRDALVLIRSASHADARQLAVMRIEGDLRHYNAVLKPLACPTSRPTAL